MSVSIPTAPRGQALPGQPRIVIDLRRGKIRISPVQTRTPSEPRPANGNGAVTDNAIARFIVIAGIERVRRVLAEFERPSLPLAAEAEAVS
jgi:hypothetical protein